MSRRKRRGDICFLLNCAAGQENEHYEHESVFGHDAGGDMAGGNRGAGRECFTPK